MLKTNKYVVTQLHTLDHKIGDVIELTDARAFALIGKVELYIEPVKPKVKRTKKAAK